MTSLTGAEPAQIEATAARVSDRAAQRRRTIEALRTGGVAEAETAERIAKRIDRLSRYYAGDRLPAEPAETPHAGPQEILTAALERGGLPSRAAVGETSQPGVVLERIINTPDFVDIRYLEGGLAAARAVCRIRIRDEAGRVVGYGTGSLVTPRLLLTNHHVLESAEVAALSAAEFNYQDGLDGQPLRPRLFSLDPETLYIADELRDFALVAVRARQGQLAPFGFNPLVEAEGKAVIGEFVTIVQHPRGEKKQVSLRENRIVDLPEAFMHYEADTEPGSSGSPVFNDQWEVVALHHASAPAPEQGELGGWVNEGIRISRILRFIKSQKLSPRQRALLEDFQLERISEDPTAVEAPPGARPPAEDRPDQLQVGAGGGQGIVRLSVPLELTLRLGTAAGVAPHASGAGPAEAPPGDEGIVIDPDYSRRKGFDPGFLGSDTPLPQLSPALLAKAVIPEGSSDPILHYHHFSVAMNRDRRLAFFTAVNIDGALSRRLRRETDRWVLDPRIPTADQIGEAVYADNDLDRGHLVRRLDPAWGSSERIAKVANDDTFHFTNCTPQHKDFNQRQTSWAGLEDYILENANNRDFKASVFTGPVLAPDDEVYRGVRLPRQFWKVAAMVKASGGLSATAYLLSQEALLEGLEAAEGFSYGAYRTYQVKVARVEDLTGLTFGPLRELDPLEALEGLTEAGVREVSSEADLTL